jgi:hypothetical protein
VSELNKIDYGDPKKLTLVKGADLSAECLAFAAELRGRGARLGKAGSAPLGGLAKTVDRLAELARRIENVERNDALMVRKKADANL